MRINGMRNLLNLILYNNGFVYKLSINGMIILFKFRYHILYNNGFIHKVAEHGTINLLVGYCYVKQSLLITTTVYTVPIVKYEHEIPKS